MTEPQPPGAVVDGVDVDAVHDAVAGCGGVAGVGAGSWGAFATYLPGRRVPGVRVGADAVELEVRAKWGPSAAQIAAEIGTALAPVVRDRRVDVTIVDIELPAEAAKADVTVAFPPEIEAPPRLLELPPAPADRPVVSHSESEFA